MEYQSSRERVRTKIRWEFIRYTILSILIKKEYLLFRHEISFLPRRTGPSTLRFLRLDDEPESDVRRAIVRTGSVCPQSWRGSTPSFTSGCTSVLSRGSTSKDRQEKIKCVFEPVYLCLCLSEGMSSLLGSIDQK